jgi:hypothetical protein
VRLWPFRKKELDFALEVRSIEINSSLFRFELIKKLTVSPAEYYWYAENINRPYDEIMLSRPFTSEDMKYDILEDFSQYVENQTYGNYN